MRYCADKLDLEIEIDEMMYDQNIWLGAGSQMMEVRGPPLRFLQMLSPFPFLKANRVCLSQQSHSPISYR